MSRTGTKPKTDWDVIIIGAGPAGMCAANELADRGISVLVVDRGRDIKERHCPMEEIGKCAECKQCDIMCGIGGGTNVHTNVGAPYGNSLLRTRMSSGRRLALEIKRAIALDQVDKIVT